MKRTDSSWSNISGKSFFEQDPDSFNFLGFTPCNSPVFKVDKESQTDMTFPPEMDRSTFMMLNQLMLTNWYKLHQKTYFEKNNRYYNTSLINKSPK